ncbi:MAG: hypothetical protein HY832_03445 [Candidatus Aenigmarchaeota archaeon]|nr:hypothetical protein [Candidatus Aenigmarchaeota archaeon]
MTRIRSALKYMKLELIIGVVIIILFLFLLKYLFWSPVFGMVKTTLPAQNNILIYSSALAIAFLVILFVVLTYNRKRRKQDVLTVLTKQQLKLKKETAKKKVA